MLTTLVLVPDQEDIDDNEPDEPELITVYQPDLEKTFSLRGGMLHLTGTPGLGASRVNCHHCKLMLTWKLCVSKLAPMNGRHLWPQPHHHLQAVLLETCRLKAHP